MRSISPQRIYRQIGFCFVIFCIAYSANKIYSGSGFESNILSLIPDTFTNQKEKYKTSKQLQQLTTNRFLLLINAKNHNQGKAVALALGSKLGKMANIRLDHSDNKLEEVEAFYYPLRQQLLTPEYRQLLQNFSAEKIARHRLGEMTGLTRGYTPFSLNDDPFNLGGKWLQNLFSSLSKVKLTDAPFITHNKSRWYLVTGKLLQSPFNLKLQNQLTQLVEKTRKQHIDITILTSGLVFHAAEGSNIARKEISTIGLGAIFAIIVLVLFIFRSPLALLYVAIVQLISIIVALTITWLVFGKIHLTTLAFGSTLLGISADYCFHYLVKYRALKNARLVQEKIVKSMIIACLSTVLAYLMQLFSPFPGLQQFAVFTSSGLLAAVFSVLLLGKYLAFDKQTKIKGRKIFIQKLLPWYQLAGSYKKTCLAMLVLLISLCLWLLIEKGYEDNIRILNTSSNKLINSETKAREIVGSFEWQRYFLVEANSSTQLFKRLSRLEEELLTYYQIKHNSILSLLRILPTPEQQKKDYQLLTDKIYSQGGAMEYLCKILEIHPCKWQEDRNNFINDVASYKPPAFFNSIIPGLNLLANNTALVMVRSSPLSTTHSPEQIQIPGVTYVDQVTELTSLLKQLRIRVTILLLSFATVLALVLLMIYRSNFPIIATPAILSCLLALTLATPSGITLFHLLALLPVVGISIDTAIFYIRPGLNESTWMASTLAALTSLFAFGLLSLSQVPVLHQMGSIIFIGLLSTWIITPWVHCLFYNNSHKENPDTHA